MGNEFDVYDECLIWNGKLCVGWVVGLLWLV